MSVSISGFDVTFTTTASDIGRVRSSVTTADTGQVVSYRLTVARNPLTLRVGTTAGGQQTVSDVTFAPGEHIVSFTPTTSPYYIEIAAYEIGIAVLTNFARLAPQVLDLVTPYAAADVGSIRMQQSLNVVWMAQRSHQTRVLERRGATSWSLRLYAPTDGPFEPLNATGLTLTPSAQTGPITITASGPLFSAVDVGMMLRLTHSGQFETASMDAVDEATDTIRVSNVGALRSFTYQITGTFVATWVMERSVGNEISFETVTSGTGVASGTISDGYDNQVIFYRIRITAYTSGTVVGSLTYSQGVTDGIARIVSVTADNAVTADVIDAFASTGATPLWYFGSWGERFGWPAAVGMHDGRLGFGRADQYWLSAADDFETHAIGPNDADAISRTLTGKMNAIAWLKGVDRLLAGSIGAEHTIMGGSLEEVLTPATVYSKPFSRRGSADTDAVIIDMAVAFINRTRERIYLARPEGGGYVIEDLTRLHPDICGPGGFKEIAFQTEPEPRLWCVRNDGEIAILAIDPSEQIAAWTRYTTPDGSFESVAVVPRGAEDGVYFVVRRDVGGATRYIEKLAGEAFTDLEDAWRLQSAIEYSGSATSTITGLSHLEGEEVYAWGNGRQSGPYTVASGQITLSYAVTYAIVGLLYDGKYKGPRLDWGANAGTALTQHKQVKGLGLMLYRTPGGMLEWGRDFDNMMKLEDRMQDGLVFDGPLQEWTEDITRTFEGAMDRDSRLHLRMAGAGPVTVLGLVPAVETNER